MGRISRLALSIFYLAMELCSLWYNCSCSRSGRYAYQAAYARGQLHMTPQWQTGYDTASPIVPAAMDEEPR
jgi:hypothetical protein